VITSHKTILSGSLDDLRRTVEKLSLDQEPHEYQAGTRLRELAVALAMQAGFNVNIHASRGLGESRVGVAPSLRRLDLSGVGPACRVDY